MKERTVRKRAYIFDVDGTLYSQRKMHLFMAGQLLKQCILHISNFAEIIIILRFRRLREKDCYKTASVADLAEVIAEEMNTTADSIQSVIRKWMFDKPIAYLDKCAYQDVLSFLRSEIRRGSVVTIYSDYPAGDKLRALNIVPHYVFSAEESQLQELKPSRQVMQHILEVIAVSKEQILYVGDRDEKDGASAEYAGVSYVDVRAFRKALKDITKSGEII